MYYLSEEVVGQVYSLKGKALEVGPVWAVLLGLGERLMDICWLLGLWALTACSVGTIVAEVMVDTTAGVAGVGERER